ncbi:N-acetylmuramoyl-L-alanine amidase [Deferribacter desulfuricans SSM1]|uniref:N-acetylmuramoyl-L-alanine amidase n=1 Tax=Deferribacter desulfuricans (strain DSM 14783 / JCM 11476 / NBRC 101012 / SSM1) TaxID=639282 RepID=D3PAA4_DEFDS|nr:N-acetylmuramoyl-L-alanine amidase [Deferribacter desulfuricans]BAI79527.1 N-acetylmuramoyl-L-alanine amidase [Deferribacter desulfuricans SSM1]
MQKFNRLIIILLVIFFVPLVYASITSEYNSAKRDLKYVEKSKKVSRQSYILIAEKFYKIYSRYPKSSLADDALYLCAKTYLKSYYRFKNRNDLDYALKYFRLLAANYKSRWAADAYYQAAYIYYVKKDYISAKYMIKKLKAKYPKSSKVKEANRLLAKIEKATNKKKVAKKGSYKKDNHKSKVANNTNKVLVRGIRYWSNKDYTRIVIDLNKKAKFEKHWLKENKKLNLPPRLFVDIYNSDVSKNIPDTINVKDGLISRIRWGKFKDDVTRVVLDTISVEDFTVFQLVNPARIVIDVSGKGDIKSYVVKNNKNEKYNNTLASVFGLKVKTIVIDPGHGGKDPGCNYYGLKEKDIVLDIGLYLRELLRKKTHLKVLMTRDRDIFIPLEERTAFANKHKADIFVSIHVNASRNRRAKGVETYVLNVTKDKSALEVAAFENQATEKSLSDLQGILKDIILNSKLEESLILAKNVQDNLVSQIKSVNLGVKQAPFYVLVGAKMPSILVETGFLSNKSEARKFATKRYREQIAEGIFDGLMSYIKKYNGK